MYSFTILWKKYQEVISLSSGIHEIQAESS